MSANIQIGHIARHTPQGAGAQGREAAIIDIAQDLLLQHLHQQDILDDLVIKGGTAIRKLYAGKEGRFSLDLDFSFARIDADPDDVTLRLIEATDGLTTTDCMQSQPTGSLGILASHLTLNTG